MNFASKVVIITGASAGIGADTALGFAKHSAKVVLVGRNERNLKDVARKCEDLKGTPLIIRADVTIDDDVKSIVKKTIEKFGRIDILVNNAGAAAYGSILDAVQLFDKAMNLNMRSAYLLTSLAVPYLIETKGNVVNVASVAGLKPITALNKFNILPYSISKAALNHFTRCLAVELGPKGVRVNSVNPGCTRTRFAEVANIGISDVNESFERYGATLPLRKIADSEEVADLIMYLASERARSITGSIHVIDNGTLIA